MDEKLCEAWREAGSDLGIDITVPFGQPLSDGSVALCEAFLPHFGSRAGALAISEKTARCHKGILQENGLWCSVLSSTYHKYDRSFFIETLDDWGWFGPADQKPAWLKY